MRNCLLRVAFLAALNGFAAGSRGQSPASNANPYSIRRPLFIVNSNTICNPTENCPNRQDIKEMVVYREKDCPDALKNLASAGILAITYNGRVKSKTFAKLGHQLGLKEPIGVVFNGHKLDAAQVATLRITPEAIGQVQVTKATAETPESVIFISLKESKPDSHAYPPGTIMIR